MIFENQIVLETYNRCHSKDHFLDDPKCKSFLTRLLLQEIKVNFRGKYTCLYDHIQIQPNQHNKYIIYRCPRPAVFKKNCLLTILKNGRTCPLLKKFIEIQGCLLLTFFIYLHNQLSSFDSIIVQMSEKRDSSNRQ